MESRQRFIAEPTRVLQQYLREHQSQPMSLWDAGRLSMALEILTTVEVLEFATPVVGASPDPVNVLRTLLADVGMLDDAEEWYELLNVWRRVKFVPASDDVRLHSVSSEQSPSSQRTLPESQPGWWRRTHAEPRSRRSLGPPSSSSEELPSEEDPPTRNEEC